MGILTDPQIRLQAGVYSRNQYAFPNTRLSTGHVIGWHAVETCCQMAGYSHEDETLCSHCVCWIRSTRCGKKNILRSYGALRGSQ